MKNRWIIFLVLFGMPVCLAAQTNEGTEFWFSFLEHRNPNLNSKVAMITSRFNTSGRVTAPLADFHMPFNVNANDVTIITLPPYAESIGSESIKTNGFKIESNDLVSVYIHQYFQFRAEATIVLPVTTIGREYFALSYAGYFTEGEHFPSQFAVIAGENETTISITLSGNTAGGRTQGSTFDILLNAGETYQVQGASESDDLSGTYIVGDKNFSLFCGNRYSALNCFRSGRDNLLEQSFSIDTWGDRFVSAPFQHNIRDIFRILSAKNNTAVNVYYDDGSSDSFIVDRGKFIEYETSNLSYIESSSPVMVAQYMNQLDCGNGFNGDPSMLYLNSILQIRDTVTLYNSSFQNIEDNFINIIARQSDLPNLEFDGSLLMDIAPGFQNVGPNDEFVSTILPVNTGAHTITSSGCGVIAKAYGLGNYESYAYSGGARFSKINASPIPDGGCLNDTVYFDSGLPEDRYDVEWVFENGDGITEHKFTRIFSALGAYPTDLFIHDVCFDLFDTLSKEVLVTLRQSVQTDPVDIFCVGETIQLGATDVSMAAYEWNGPNEFFSNEQYPLLTDVSTDNSGNYEVISIVSGCATFPADIEVEIKPLPTPELGEDRVFCPEAEVPTILNVNGDYAAYEWSDGAQSQNTTVYTEGLYTVTVTDNFSCQGVDSISITQQCPTKFYVPDAFTPNGDGVNDYFGVFGDDIISLDLRIYDRWGNEVFTTMELSSLWDGRQGILDSSIGVYAWVLILEGYREDGSVFMDTSHGSLTLIR